jgi:DNA-binding response OmpR family regulator
MLDLAMPEFTGLDVIKSLEQDGIIKSKNSGVKEVFKKPCSLDELVELIEKYRPRQ